MPARTRSRARVAVATAIAAALVATTVDASATFVHPRSAPKVQKEPSVRGRDAQVEPAHRDTTAEAAARPVERRAWPAPSSAAVRVPSTGRVRAGGLPVSIGPADSRAAGSTVSVEVLPRSVAERGGIVGVPFRVTRADAGKTPARITIAFDYSSFENVVGGDWASRLRIVALPSGEPVASWNHYSSRTVTATVDALAADVEGSEESTATYAVAAAPSGGAGSYNATSLAPSAAWQVSTQTGAFNWSHPFRVPPSVNGPAPALQLSYSSASVDGRTASTNAQPSWIGEGHSLETGYIERKYVPCADDMTGGNNAAIKTNDLCWRTDNANVVLAGHSGELVKDPVNGWRLENDDASRFERFTGGFNGDNDTEYWKLTTPDGTQYFFGLGKRYATDTIATNATWTVPVFGNHPGEPCYQATWSLTSSCTQAWRWNLAYVVDPHGNTMTYTYAAETNNYQRNKTATTSGTFTSYHRGGYLTKIEYGERKGTEHSTTAPAQVDFGVSERCVTATTSTFNCETTAINSTNASNWPDVPFDQICTASPCAQTSPSFFTRKRLTTATTRYLSGTTMVPVDSWTFAHSFPSPGDNTPAALWLASLQHTGHVGTAIALPKVTFAGVQMQNRVDGLDTSPPLIKWRISSITSETGAVTSVNYMPQECVASTNVPASPETNDKRCFPVYWTPEGASAPSRHWFHKYVVANVVDDDKTGSSSDKLTTYEYLDTPAWHYDDNELGQPKYRTYSDFRGYGRVRTVIGAAGEQSVTEQLFLRGMDEDPLPSGLVRDVDVRDSQGGLLQDHPRLNGQLRETRSFVAGAEVGGAIYDPWISAPTATNGTSKAYRTGNAKTRSRTVLAAGGVRRSESSRTFDAYGMVSAAEDLGDLTIAADDLCTRTTYARNTTAWIVNAVARVETVSVACAATPARPADVVSDTRTYYDGSTVVGAAPTRGLPSKTEALDSWSGGPVYKQQNRLVHDVHGRLLESYDALEQRTAFAYTPATGGPVTQMTETNPASHVETTALHPAWGVKTAGIDPNGQRTDLSYDALGRLTQAWLPGRAKASFATSPNMRFTYLIRNNGPIVVTTEELRNDGTYTPTYALYDGLLRPRQTQRPAPGGGRAITDTTYDSRGLAVDANGPYFNSLAPGTSLFVVSDAEMPSQVRTSYDGANRPIATAFRVYGIEQWRTATTYGGDRVHVDPPEGETATTTLLDERGNVTALRQYHGGAPNGTYDETTYDYMPGGQRKAVHDAAGNHWTYEYDLRGRVTRTTDPDRGVSDITYDALGRVATTTDARQRTLANVYDNLGRQTELRDGSATGTKLASWGYDAVVGAKGMPSSSSRWVGSDEYRSEVTAYDAAYRPTSSRVVIPAVEGALAATYTTTTAYNVDGSVKSVGLPVAPGLPPETLQFGYDTLGLPKSLQGYGSYVANTTLSSFGEILQFSLGNTVGKTSWQTFYYETGTRRLTRAMVDRANATMSDSDVHYTYDAVGNVKKIADTPVGDTAPDTQCFTYDHLRRLTEAWTATDDCVSAPSAAVVGGPAPYWRGYTYDVTGNRVASVDHTASGDVRRAYDFPAPGVARPHALRAVTTTQPDGTAATDQFGYDLAGNLESRTVDGVSEALTWDAEGRLAAVDRGSARTSFLYGADGGRLIRRDPSGTTLYLGNTEIRLDAVTGTKNSTRYYSHAGLTIAVRQGSDVDTLSSDRHGTATVAIDNATATVTKRRFDPFGLPRDAGEVTWTGERTFVGGTSDASTKLVHLGARQYDAAHGRFISVDPLMDASDPQQINGYAYANNNPVSFSDPDGLIVDRGEGGGAGAPSGGGSSGATQTTKPKPHKPTNAAFDHLHDAEAPLTAEQHAAAVLDGTKARRERARQDAIDAAKELVSVAADVLGVTAALDCITQGDIGSCGQAVIQIAIDFVAGAAFKLIKKYGLPWNMHKGIAAGKKLWRLADKLIDRVRGFLRASDDVATAAAKSAEARLSSVDDVLGGLAKGRQRNVRTVTSDAQLQSVYDDLARGGSPIEVPGYKGSWVERPDGVRVGLRDSSKSGGRAIDIRLPNGSMSKVHTE